MENWQIKSLRLLELRMSVTSFIHLKETENSDFDIKKFNRDIKEKYPGTRTEQSNSQSLSYDICWEKYSDCYQFELRIDRKRCTFAIEYFNSNDRICDYASFILWIRMYFPKEKEVILVDENYEDQMPLSSNVSIEDIKKWLERVGI